MKYRLTEDVARRLRESRESRVPRDLYKDWREKFPAEVDIEAALKQVRGRWLDDLDQL